MAKVKALKTFIGTSEEVNEFGGQLPEEMKKFEKKMSKSERASYNGRITRGTSFEVTDARKKELLKAGVIEGSEKELAEAEVEREKGTSVLHKENTAGVQKEREAERNGDALTQPNDKTEAPKKAAKKK